MKNLKYILLGAAVILCCIQTKQAVAQTSAPSAIAGPTGNWVVCGEVLPKNFSYRISRQQEGGAWVAMATLTMPAGAEELKAAAYRVQKASRMEIDQFDNDRINNLWKRVNDPVATSSPAEIGNDLVMRAATGTAWYDANATAKILYRYKVQIIDGKSVNDGNTTQRVSYPGTPFNTDLTPVSVKPMLNGVTLEYKIVNAGQMVFCKIKRSYYLRTGFEEINAQPMFTGRENENFIQFTDETAVAKVPYTYIVVPIDKAGNEGYTSPEAKLFNVADRTIEPSVHNFRAFSNEAQRSIKLSWQLDNLKDVVSVDVYKSDTYDGIYQKIGANLPTDTIFSDNAVAPITTYYYTIKLNGRYESSPASPRIPAILKASEPNPVSPANINVTQDGNRVLLSWRRNKSHTHAWLVYRAGPDGKSEQIGSPIITDSMNVSFTDQLPESGTSTAYTYRVADENTSYVISPLSIPVFAYSTGLSSLPIPYGVVTRRENGHTATIIWRNLARQFSNFNGYRLYRRSPNGKTELLSNRILPREVNFYTDSTLSQPGVYYYSLRTVSRDGAALSSPSLDAGFTIEREALATVSNIKVMPSNVSVAISWDNPMGQLIKGIQVYRALEGQTPQLLTTLPAGTRWFNDDRVKKGDIYYYTFINQDINGNLSATTDPLGVHF